MQKNNLYGAINIVITTDITILLVYTVVEVTMILNHHIITK